MGNNNNQIRMLIYLTIKTNMYFKFMIKYVKNICINVVLNLNKI